MSNDEEIIFTVDPGYIGGPIAGKSVRLARHRYDTHISRKHIETKDRLHDIEYTVRSPHYVAHCVPGPGNKHVQGLCFVRTDATPKLPIEVIRRGKTITVAELERKSYIHVMVQADESGPYVATALFSDKYHGEIIWETPVESEESESAETSCVDASYDIEADIVYLSKGEVVPAYSTIGADGLLLRYAMDDQRPCGVTIMSFHDWDDYRDQLADHIAAFLQIARHEAKNVLDGQKEAA